MHSMVIGLVLVDMTFSSQQPTRTQTIVICFVDNMISILSMRFVRGNGCNEVQTWEFVFSVRVIRSVQRLDLSWQDLNFNINIQLRL